MWRLVAQTLICALALSACAVHDRSGGDPQLPATPAAPPAAPAPPVGLNDSAWVLMAIAGAPALAEPLVRLEFSAGTARGFAGCNFFGGTYQSDGTMLRFSAIEQTAILCSELALQRQEQSFITALQAVDSYAFVDQTLTLRDTARVARLVFRAQVRQAVDPALLRDTSWRLLSIAGALPVGARPLTLSLDASGQARGDAGCRTFTAAWQAQDDRMSFPMIAMDQETCVDAALLVQEGAFTDALSTVHTYQIVDGQLELRSDRNGPLRFTAMP